MTSRHILAPDSFTHTSTSRRALLRGLTIAPVGASVIAAPWGEALASLHQKHGDDPVTVARTKDGRASSRHRYHTAEGFFPDRDPRSSAGWQSFLYFSGITAQLGLSAHLLDVGFPDSWCARHIGLRVAKSLAYAKATGFAHDCPDMARLAAVLTPYCKWNAVRLFGDRETLWNEVEAIELRKDAQLAREVEFAIPRELTKEQGIALARDFVQTEFVDRGMIADLNVHWDIGADGQPKPHAHIMLTLREVGGEASPDGFGGKVRDWNDHENVEHWRERWETHVNARLSELDIDARIDRRSLADQGIDLEPQSKIGGPAQRMERQGQLADRAELHREIARENGMRIIANPAIALDAITHQQATFTGRDLAMFAHRHSDGVEQYGQVLSAVHGSPDLIALGKDGRGEDRFTSRDMIEAEQRLHRAADLMAQRERHRVAQSDREGALARAGQRDLDLAGEQRAAFDHVTDPHRSRQARRPVHGRLAQTRSPAPGRLCARRLRRLPSPQG